MWVCDCAASCQSMRIEGCFIDWFHPADQRVWVMTEPVFFLKDTQCVWLGNPQCSSLNHFGSKSWAQLICVPVLSNYSFTLCSFLITSSLLETSLRCSPVIIHHDIWFTFLHTDFFVCLFCHFLFLCVIALFTMFGFFNLLLTIVNLGYFFSDWKFNQKCISVKQPCWPHVANLSKMAARQL